MLLSDVFWYTFGAQIIRNYDQRHVNPTSYDCHLASDIRLQVLNGVEYPDVLATLNKNGTMTVSAHGDKPEMRIPSIFQPGDVFLGSTTEYFRLGRWINLTWMDKSSTGREGLTHHRAGHIDPGFSGNITLEYQVLRSGILRPLLPVGQVVANLTFAWTPYNKRKSSRYRDQQGATSNRNTELCFESLVMREYRSKL